MNDQELTRAVWLDLAAIYKSSTIPRLKEEYDRERRKKKISVDRKYSRCYSIRTKAKNNWMIFLEKAPILPKYKGKDDICFYCIVYYFGPKGFTVFKPNAEAFQLFVYQGHVFTRYCQRMQLDISSPVENIRHFFTYNGCSDHQVIERKDRLFSMGICRDGVLLGDYRAELNWVFNRTFVNRDIFRRYQDEAEIELMQDFAAWAEQAMANKLPPEDIFAKANLAHAIFCPPEQEGNR